METRKHHEIRGVVVSDKMEKTRIIEIERLTRHGLYHKSIMRSSRVFVHDEKNESKIGDVIVAASTRPLSRHKNYRLVKIAEKRAAQ